jgi:hypothetical protein
MKNIKFHVLIIFLICPLFAKDIYFTRSGTISFYSSALIEDIEAVNKQVTCVLDMGTGEVAFRVPILGFTFENGLMQEHFNENYLESNIYPRSTFEGKIINFNDITENFKNYQITGNLTIKGVTKEINTTAVIRKLKNKVELMSNFSVMLSDFGIKIPKIVFKKIDEEVKINLNFVYGEKN